MTAQQSTQTTDATQTSDLVGTVSEATQKAAGMMAVAKSYVIDSAEMAECAADDLNQWSTAIKNLNEQRMELTRPLDDSKARIIAMFAVPIGTANQAVTMLKSSLLDWNRKEEIRIAKAKAEAEAERIKQEEESARMAVKLEEQKQAALETGDMKALEILEDQEAEADSAAAAMMYAPPVVTKSTKVAGSSVRSNWKAEVIDLMALVKAIASGAASIELIQANNTALNSRAKALKAEFKVDGVRVYDDKIVVATGRKR